MKKKKPIAPLTEAEKQIVADNMGVVVDVAMGMKRCKLPLKDRVQAGATGLIEAVKSDDGSQRAKIGTYSHHFIKSAIRNAESRDKAIYVPIRMRFKFSDPKKQARVNELLAKTGPTDSIEAMPLSKLEAAVLIDAPGEPTQAEEDASAAFDSLEERFQEVIRHRVWGGDSIDGAAKALGCNRKTVMAREARAFSLLRDTLWRHAPRAS